MATSTPRTIIGETKTVPIDAIEAHPENPRDSDVGAIVESIRSNGFYGKIICQERDGEKPRIIVGEHRWRAASIAGLREVPVEMVRVSDQAARAIMLVDNRTQDLASYDDGLLADLLVDIARDGEEALLATGYDPSALDGLLASLKSPLTEGEAGDSDSADANGDPESEYRCPKCGYEWRGKPK